MKVGDLVLLEELVKPLEDLQKRIQERFPNVKIIITDHHNPDPEMVIEENDKTVNKYKELWNNFLN